MPSIIKAYCCRLAGAAMAASSSSRPAASPHGLTARPCTTASRSGPVNCTARSPASSRSKRLSVRAQAGAATSTPAPVVKIDNISDPFATVVSVEWAEAATELLDTITAIKNLGLNIRRAQLTKKAAGNANTFYITDADTSEKIVRSARLEELRQTIINSLVAQFPDTASFVSTGASTTADLDMTRMLGARRRMVQTTIDVSDAPNGSCSVLKIETRDRPGLLVDIVKVLKDINLNVVSAEVDTIGNLAKDEFFVTYHGEPLPAPMVVLVTNALQYYLSLNEVAREESY